MDLLTYELLDGCTYAPTRAHDTDAGIDLCVQHDTEVRYGKWTKVGLGVRVALPPSHFALLLPRSSLAKTDTYMVTGVIDNGYRGELSAMLRWEGAGDTWSTVIPAGTRIYQLVLIPQPAVQLVAGKVPTDTPRGTGGFGSTGGTL